MFVTPVSRPPMIRPGLRVVKRVSGLIPGTAAVRATNCSAMSLDWPYPLALDKSAAS